jgi:hypothetical protein
MEPQSLAPQDGEDQATPAPDASQATVAVKVAVPPFAPTMLGDVVTVTATGMIEIAALIDLDLS